MASTYTEWAKEILEKVGTKGASKLIAALQLEAGVENLDATMCPKSKSEDIDIKS